MEQVAARYATDVEARLTLDELPVRFRALHDREEQPIRALYAGLGADARYRRFLSPMPTLPDSLVRALSSVDHRRSLAIVAEDAVRGGVIALASFSAIDDRTVEVAVAVQDQWQGHGVGTALVDALLSAAERRGFSRFSAAMTVDNAPMRRILNRFGRVVTRGFSSGVFEFVFVRRPLA
jgi:RimJ/RimL family protein N-acetyltransferase